MLRQTHFFGRARRVRRTARAKPDRVHKIWAARADQFYPSRFLPGARVYINHYAFLSFGAGPRGCIRSVPGIRKCIAALESRTMLRSLSIRLLPSRFGTNMELFSWFRVFASEIAETMFSFDGEVP